MNRTTRTFVVVGVAILIASIATYLVFRALTSRPTVVVQAAETQAVVAARPLALGTRLTAADVKLVPWPSASQVPGSYRSVEDVLDRGVLMPIAENQPLTDATIASREAGAGLPPTIPSGMRAISVKVNEVVGVAGFVVPGTRVDVMVIIQDGSDSVARVVVSNVQVLAAGTKYDQDMAREGEAVQSSVVTLLATPEDAQRIGLAANEGQVMLTLRNPLDTEVAIGAALRTTNLARGTDAEAPRPAAPRPAAPRAAPPPPPPAAAVAPPPYTVETIRGAQRSQETIAQ